MSVEKIETYEVSFPNVDCCMIATQAIENLQGYPVYGDRVKCEKSKLIEAITHKFDGRDAGYIGVEGDYKGHISDIKEELSSVPENGVVVFHSHL